MKIAIVNTTRKRYGGSAYENMVREALSENFDVELISAGVKSKGVLKYFEAPLLPWRIYKTSKRKEFDIVIRNFEASLFLNEKPAKNITIVHHIDSSYSGGLMKIFYSTFGKKILNNLKKADAIVTVSKYWKNFFQEKGYKNVYTIYNAFDIDKFNFSDEEISEFKKKFKLLEKPIIYIGNCQKKKGVVESYQKLKDLNAYLITSGKTQVKIPAINLNLADYREYLKLLKASSIVVTMSKFKEGWCRTAHEAMLCKTPVIGSGLGAMEELLEGGQQIICRDFNSLKGKVEYLLNHPEVRKKMVEDGYNFAKEFTVEKFKDDWLNLIRKLT